MNYFIALKWFLISFLVILGITIPFFLVEALTPPFTDDFESYDLGDLNGQGDWTVDGADKVMVVDEKSQGGAKSIKFLNTSYAANRIFDVSTEGIISFWIFAVDNTSRLRNTITDIGNAGIQVSFGSQESCGAETCSFWYNDNWTWKEYGDFDIGKWYSVQIKWWTEAEIFKWDFNFNFEGWATGGITLSPLSSNVYQFYSNGINSFLDTISGETTPPELEIKGISPDSGTTITDLDTDLTIEYKEFDWETYDGFFINFRDSKLGIVADSIQFLKEDLDPSGNGSEIINLQDFNFDSNGQWYLTGLGFGTELDIEGGMFLTTRGYIDFWTDELVKTPYYLIINVEGLPSPYTFTDPSDWYSANVERFDTPTILFTSFVNLLSPIFEKVGDFGIRTQNIFDLNEAYDRGFALGEIFPLINAYIKKIESFFGGFPLASFFIYLILVMLAIFIIRSVLKFIPFFG